MILARYPMAVLPFTGDRWPETYSTRVAFVETESLGAVGKKIARTPAAFSETETLGAKGKLRARVHVAFVEREVLDVESEKITNKFVKLINQADARRVYVMSMTIRQFRE